MWRNPFAQRKRVIQRLIEQEGMEMLVLGMSGIPVAGDQMSLTPLQREVLIGAFVRMKEMEAESMKG